MGRIELVFEQKVFVVGFGLGVGLVAVIGKLVVESLVARFRIGLGMFEVMVAAAIGRLAIYIDFMPNNLDFVKPSFANSKSGPLELIIVLDIAIMAFDKSMPKFILTSTFA